MDGWGPFAGGALAWGLVTTLRVTLLLAGALVLSLLLQRSAASARHALWTVTFAALLLLPVLPLALPTIPVPLPQAPSESSPSVEPIGLERGPLSPGLGGAGAEPGTDAVGPLGAEAGRRVLGADAPREAIVPGRDGSPEIAPPGGGGALALEALLLLWFLGTAGFAVSLGLGLRRARQACLRSSPVREERWLEAFRRARGAVGVRGDVALRLSPAVRTGMAGGLLRPVVLLPETARSWCPERREIVLVHELIHLKRRDPLRKLCGRVALALYWFHPLAWCAVRASALAREEACDEAVVALGHRPSAYARHLLALADPAPLPMPALARIDRSHLETRIMKLLRTSSSGSSRPAAAVVALAVVWALTVAALTPSDGAHAAPQANPAVADTPVVRAAPPAPPAIAMRPEAAPAPTPASDPEPPPTPEPPPAAEPPPVAAVAPPLPPAPAVDPAHGCRIRPDGPDFEDGRDWGIRGTDQAVGGSGDRFVQRSLDGHMLCLRTRGGVRFDEETGRIAAMPDGSWLVLAVRGEGARQRLEITGGLDGPAHAWFVDGEPRAFDEDARAWRDAMLAVLGAHAEIASARGEEARLRGEMARARGEEARLRGEIARTRGEEARIRGESARVRGQEASIRGETARIRGEEARLRGEIARTRGEAARVQAEASRMEVAITSLEQARRASTDTVTRVRLEAEIEEARRAVVEARQRMNEDDTERRVAEVQQLLEAHREQASARLVELEGLLRGLDTEERVREIEELRRSREAETGTRIQEVEAAVAALDTEVRVRAIQERIEALDTEARVRALQESASAAEERLRQLIGRVR
jgi:beta-lactamase regulating signal transducer with metallopeptidase domain